MSALRDSAHRIARAGPLPMPPAERLLRIEKTAARLAMQRSAGTARESEDWDAFLRRIGVIG